MPLSLKLELKSGKKVLVTNSETNEKKEVTLGFLQEITGDSLLMLAQYKYYELIVNAERHWNRIKRFNLQHEKNKEIYIEQKFREVMTNDQWIKITDYEREMYYKALAFTNSYNPQKSSNKIDKTAIVAAGSGAATGVLIRCIN